MVIFDSVANIHTYVRLCCVERPSLLHENYHLCIHIVSFQPVSSDSDSGGWQWCRLRDANQQSEGKTDANWWKPTTTDEKLCFVTYFPNTTDGISNRISAQLQMWKKRILSPHSPSVIYIYTFYSLKRNIFQKWFSQFIYSNEPKAHNCMDSFPLKAYRNDCCLWCLVWVCASGWDCHHRLFLSTTE